MKKLAFISFLVLAASTSFAKDIYCTNQSNSDWTMTLSVNAEGKAESLVLSNQDWGGYGMGGSQSLTFNEATKNYNISSIDSTKNVGVALNTIVRIESQILEGKSGELVLDYQNAYNEYYSCN